ncbi:MAG TPA: hypothetical protein VN688_24995 [Gemmataceae bacterium]|nr:hypothetical protein [Gemmataceae bacterium]
MDQKLEGTPRAEIRLEGRRVIRGEVSNDWGSRLQWLILRDGKEIAAVNAARTANSYEHPDKTPGKYEIVLQMWKYIDYRKGKDGKYVNSKYIDVSNKVAYQI